MLQGVVPHAGICEQYKLDSVGEDVGREWIWEELDAMHMISTHCTTLESLKELKTKQNKKLLVLA